MRSAIHLPSSPFDPVVDGIRFWIPVLLLGLCAGLVASGMKVALLPIGAVFGIIGALIFLHRPELIFWAISLTVLFNDHLGLPLGGMNLRPYVGLTALGIGALILLGRTGRVDSQLARSKRILWLFIPLFALIAGKLVSWYLISDSPMGMPKSYPLKHLVFASLLYTCAFTVAVYTPGRRGLERMLIAWLFLSSVAAIIGMIQILASNGLGMHWVHQRAVIFYGRPFSWFREPDVFGSVMGATTMMVLPLLLLRVPLQSRAWLWFHLACNGSMLMLLFVRAAWLGSIVAGGLLALCLLRLRKIETTFPYMKTAAAGVVGLAILLPIAAPQFVHELTERFASMAKPEEEGASAYRMQDLSAMWAEAKPNGRPFDKEMVITLFGHGDMTWSYWAPFLIGNKYDTTALRLLRNFGYVKPHPGFCMALTYFFDNGAVGIGLAGLFFLILFGKVVVRCHLHQKPDDAGLLLATALPVLVLIVCFQFSYDPITPFFWVLIGLSAAALDAVDHPKENA